MSLLSSNNNNMGDFSDDMMRLANSVSRPMPTRVSHMVDSSFNMNSQSDLNGSNFDDTSRLMSKGNDFVPDLDMMALLRAKEKLNMMQRGGNVQDRIRAFSRDQYAKGQGIPLSTGTLDNLEVSSTMIDNLKRSATELKPSDDSESEEPKGKRRKKAKKPSDMPRRALSAYNIFFSEQRQMILDDIAAKERGEDPDAKKNNDEKNDKTPSVLNRTFFPARTKRAHRKVHGKIGLVDLAREVSQRWKALSPEKRKKYTDLAEQDRQRHKKVMAEYQERKSAENMLTISSPVQAPEEAPEIPTMQRVPSEQELREMMTARQQQRILAEMMTARQQAQPNMGMSMGMSNMGMSNMGVSNMSNMGGMGMSNMGMSNMSVSNMNNMGSIGMSNMGMNNMSGMGMSNMGMSNMGMNNMSGMGMSNMGMSNMGMSNMNNMSGMGMSNMGMSNMSGMGMSNMGMSSFGQQNQPNMNMRAQLLQQMGLGSM